MSALNFETPREIELTKIAFTGSAAGSLTRNVRMTVRVTVDDALAEHLGMKSTIDAMLEASRDRMNDTPEGEGKKPRNVMDLVIKGRNWKTTDLRFARAIGVARVTSATVKNVKIHVASMAASVDVTYDGSIVQGEVALLTGMQCIEGTTLSTGLHQLPLLGLRGSTEDGDAAQAPEVDAEGLPVAPTFAEDAEGLAAQAARQDAKRARSKGADEKVGKLLASRGRGKGKGKAEVSEPEPEAVPEPEPDETSEPFGFEDDEAPEAPEMF